MAARTPQAGLVFSHAKCVSATRTGLWALWVVIGFIAILAGFLLHTMAKVEHSDSRGLPKSWRRLL